MNWDPLNLKSFCKLTSERIRIPCILAEKTVEMIQGTGCRKKQTEQVLFVTTPYAQKCVQLTNRASMTRTDFTGARRCLSTCAHIYTCTGRQTNAHITINSRVRAGVTGVPNKHEQSRLFPCQIPQKAFSDEFFWEVGPLLSPEILEKEIRRPIYCQTLSGTANTTEPSD